jgi:hypothetical protein
VASSRHRTVPLARSCSGQASAPFTITGSGDHDRTEWPFTINGMRMPCLIANHKSQQWFSITMFLYLAVSSIFSGFAYYDAFFRSKSSTAALTLVFIPFYQWLAIALLLLLCLGIRRARRSVENGC